MTNTCSSFYAWWARSAKSSGNFQTEYKNSTQITDKLTVTTSFLLPPASINDIIIREDGEGELYTRLDGYALNKQEFTDAVCMRYGR